MRRRNGIRAAAPLLLGVALLGGPAAGQDPVPRTTIWPLRKIDFPVPVADLQKEAKRPTKLRFFVAPQNGRFDKVGEKEPDQLDVLSAARNQRGFSYKTDRDGVYDFAVQFVYADGSTEPKESNLVPEWRVTFDTRPPVLTVRQAAPARLEWDATDDHLGPQPVTVETRWPGGKWQPVGKKFAARDGYTWPNLRADDPLEAQVIARDKAGHEAVSRVFTLPGKGDGGRLPAPALDRDDGGRRDTGFGDAAPGGPPPTEYVNTPSRQLVVRSKLSKVTRSGVSKAFLWVNDGKATGWKQAGAEDQNIPGGATDKTIEMGYRAPADGLYGFIVIPQSKAGTRDPDPEPATRPQYYVYVDTQPPAVQVTRADAAPGGAAGPRVTVEWTVTEAGSGLMPESIEVGYAPTKAGPFKPLTERKVENTGRYTWDVEDKALWQCFVQVTATDKAGNRGSHVFDKELFLDLEKPAAVIERVVGAGDGGRLPPESPPPPQTKADPPGSSAPTPPATPTNLPAAPSTQPTNPPPVGGPPVPPVNPIGVPPVPPLPGPPK